MELRPNGADRFARDRRGSNADADDPTAIARVGPWPNRPRVDRCIRSTVLHLEPVQIERLNKILRANYEESLLLEARNTEQHHDVSGHLVLLIKPSPGPIAKLENRLWSELDGILNPQQQSIGPPESRA